MLLRGRKIPSNLTEAPLRTAQVTLGRFGVSQGSTSTPPNGMLTSKEIKIIIYIYTSKTKIYCAFKQNMK